MSTLTGRIVAGLRADLAREGHTDVTVPDEPTIEDLAQACDLLHVPVATFVERIEREDCPAWCERHSLDVTTHEMIHRRATKVGPAEVVLEYAPGDAPGVAVLLPEWPEATPESARDLVAALTQALELLEASNPSMVRDRVDPDALSTAEVIDSMGRTQSAATVNESGL